MKRLWIVMLLSFLLVACEEEPPEEIITVSETPQVIVVSVNNELGDKVLVPEGRAMAVNDVEQVTFTYEVSIITTELTRGLMEIEAIDVLIDGKEDYSNLVEITIMDEVGSKRLPVFTYAITVSVTVKLLEPIDMDEAIANGWDLSVVNVEDAETAYADIIGKDITFSLQFQLIET